MNRFKQLPYAASAKALRCANAKEGAYDAPSSAGSRSAKIRLTPLKLNPAFIF